MATGRGTRVLFPLLVFAVLLAGVEVGVRLRVPHYASRDFFLTLFGDPPDATPKTEQPLFEGDPQTFWRLRPNVEHAIWDFTMVSTNAQGLRHDRPLDHKPAGRFRIVCVGDSVTFGYRIPLVFPEHPDHYDHGDAPYPARLERMLRSEFPGRDVEVVALAVPGYSSYQGRLLLEHTISWLEPDVVVICFGFNDIAYKPSPDAVLMTRDPLSTTLRRVMISSQALLHLWRWWTAGPATARKVELPEPGPRVSRVDYVANVDAMAELARAAGATVLVVGPVYRDRTTNRVEAQHMTLYRGTLREAMRIAEIPYVQIDELTEDAAPGNAPLFGEHVHPSSLGHQLMAERILAALRAEGMLKPLES